MRTDLEAKSEKEVKVITKEKYNKKSKKIKMTDLIKNIQNWVSGKKIIN